MEFQLFHSYTLWLFNVANWKITMFNSKIIMLIIYKWTMFIHFLLC